MSGLSDGCTILCGGKGLFAESVGISFIDVSIDQNLKWLKTVCITYLPHALLEQVLRTVSSPRFAYCSMTAMHAVKTGLFLLPRAVLGQSDRAFFKNKSDFH